MRGRSTLGSCQSSTATSAVIDSSVSWSVEFASRSDSVRTSVKSIPGRPIRLPTISSANRASLARRRWCFDHDHGQSGSHQFNLPVVKAEIHRGVADQLTIVIRPFERCHNIQTKCRAGSPIESNRDWQACGEQVERSILAIRRSTHW